MTGSPGPESSRATRRQPYRLPEHGRADGGMAPDELRGRHASTTLRLHFQQAQKAAPGGHHNAIRFQADDRPRPVIRGSPVGDQGSPEDSQNSLGPGSVRDGPRNERPDLALQQFG